MNKYSNKEIDFSFEKKFCLEHPETFINEALGLRYSAEVLYEYENLKTRQETGIAIFSSSLVNKGYFPYRVIRMLFSYSLENLLKCLIVKNYKSVKPEEYEIPFKKIDGHDLKELYLKAKVDFPDHYALYVSSWTKCSIWAGRYPLPKNADQMYQSRQSITSPEGDAVGEIRFSFGKMDKIAERDILHTDISSQEYIAYIEMFDNLHQKATSIND